jgi:hypothetical protein
VFPLPAWGGEGNPAVGTIIIISGLALGLAFGIFILVRLRAETVEDEEDQRRLPPK